MRALARGAHTAKSNRLGRLPTLRVWLRHAVATARPLRIARDYGGLHPIPPPFPIRGRGRGVTSAAAGNGPPGTAARASKRSAPTPERTPKHTGKAPRPKAPGNSPLTNCPPLWYSCPRGVASAAAASAALQHLQGSPGAAKARKVTSAFRAFILPPHCPPARPSPHPMRLTQQNLLILLRSSCGSLVHRSDKRPRLGVSPLGSVFLGAGFVGAFSVGS